MSDPLQLSVVVPAYDEERTLAAIVHKVLALPLGLEVIIVDDGSRDRTVEIAEGLAASDARVRLLRHAANTGKGAAVRTGITAARGEVVVIQDADLEYDPQDFLHMLAEMKRLGSPVIHGSRRLRYHSANTRATYYWGGVALSWITNLLYGSRLTDEPTCYKMWRRELIQSIPLRSDGFEFCPEVTAKVLRLGHSIPEVQIRYEPRTVAEGKKIRWRDGLHAIWVLVKLRFAKPT